MHIFNVFAYNYRLWTQIYIKYKLSTGYTCAWFVNSLRSIAAVCNLIYINIRNIASIWKAVDLHSICVNVLMFTFTCALYSAQCGLSQSLHLDACHHRDSNASVYNSSGPRDGMRDPGSPRKVILTCTYLRSFRVYFCIIMSKCACLYYYHVSTYITG